MKTSYTTFDIEKALKIPKERLREWIIRGYVKPSVQQATGQGTKALFSLNDVYGIALFRRLIDSGFSRESAAEYVKGFIARRLPNGSNSTQVPQWVVFWRAGGSMESMSIVPGGFGIDFRTGSLIMLGDENIYFSLLKLSDGVKKEFPEHKGYRAPWEQPWDQILIINILQIREGVDAGLAGL